MFIKINGNLLNIRNVSFIGDTEVFLTGDPDSIILKKEEIKKVKDFLKNEIVIDLDSESEE